MLLGINSPAQNNYNLHIRSVDKDSAFLSAALGLQSFFDSRLSCTDYINKLPAYLQAKGYVTASIDSLHYDSAFASILLFVGEKYHWAQLDAKKVDPEILNAVGWNEKQFSEKPMDFVQVKLWEERILDYLENIGHPFARISLDSFQIDNEKVYALLNVQKGPLYKVDSIRVYGNAKISNIYLQRYLDIPNGSIYNKQKLLGISKKIREL
ncbi:MAG: hypothetical protein ABUT20_33545, partial [Bacteroidota bacterium]